MYQVIHSVALPNQVRSTATLNRHWNTHSALLQSMTANGACSAVPRPAIGAVMTEVSLMRMSPSGLCIILSIPLGPKEERMSRATDLAATMLALCACKPLSLPFFSCSCQQKTS